MNTHGHTGGTVHTLTHSLCQVCGKHTPSCSCKLLIHQKLETRHFLQELGTLVERLPGTKLVEQLLSYWLLLNQILIGMVCVAQCKILRMAIEMLLIQISAQTIMLLIP
jgi:hypothetical protein